MTLRIRPTNHPLCTCARSDVKHFCEYNFLFAICLKHKSTAINGVNEKTPESHEYKRQLRLEKQREKSRARLACADAMLNIKDAADYSYFTDMFFLVKLNIKFAET